MTNAKHLRSQQLIMTRNELLNLIYVRIAELSNGKILRIAIDGVDGAGKTTFADELAAFLSSKNKIIRASVDGFHNPKAVRYRRGRDSPEGFFLDSYNYEEFRKSLLDPLSSNSCGFYRTRIFDHKSDSPIDTQPILAEPGSILIVDGIFLHRPELRDYWDFSIFLDVDFSISIPRGAQRGPDFGSADPKAPENYRYIEGQKLYFRKCYPKYYASMVVNNDDLLAPTICLPTNAQDIKA